MRRKAKQTIERPTHCMHGYSEKFRTCLTCHKDPGQCDWGACEAPGTDHKRNTADGKLIEVRTLCGDHARLCLQLDGHVYSGANPCTK